MKKYMEDKNYYYNIVRHNIRKYRIQKGISRIELSKMISYSSYYISEIESLKKNKSFSLIILGRIADVLEIDIKDFFNK